MFFYRTVYIYLLSLNYNMHTKDGIFENRNYEESKANVIENKELLEDKELRKGYN